MSPLPVTAGGAHNLSGVSVQISLNLQLFFFIYIFYYREMLNLRFILLRASNSQTVDKMTGVVV